MTLGEGFPKISVIIPSYNQGQFIEETLNSIVSQNYPDTEIIVIDGGSTDSTKNILENYSKKIDYWCSEKDEGQSHALIKGFERATGDILCWVNSDDLLFQRSLHHVSHSLPLNTPCWLLGHSQQINSLGKETANVRYVDYVNQSTFFQYKYRWFAQPSTFWNRKMLDKVGLPNRKFQYIMDLDYFSRMNFIARPIILDKVLSKYRIHASAKTSAEPELVDNEYAIWMVDKFSDKNMSIETKTSIFLDYIILQRNFRTLQEHPVISRLAKFWKKHVNKRIYIDKNYL